MSGYTKVDNWLFDEVLPNVTGGTFKLLMIVERQTSGWNKKSDAISVSQFEAAMGMTRPTVIACLKEALDGGYLKRKKAGKGFIYWLPTSKKTLPDQLNNLTSTSKETLPVTSKKIKPTKEKNKDNIKELKNHFTNTAGIFPSGFKYAEDWEMPLQAMLDRAGGLHEAKTLIERAVDFARSSANGKKYTIASPRSIVNIAANLEEVEEGLKVGSR
jgi:phage replication O-like protein O